MYTIQYMYGLNIQTSVVGYLQYWAVNTCIHSIDDLLKVKCLKVHVLISC